MDKSIDEPLLFIIFGGTGDLMRRKLLPAFLNVIAKSDINPEYISLLGVARETEYDDQSYRHWISKKVHGDEVCEKLLEEHDLVNRIYYQPLPESSEKEFVELSEKIRGIEDAAGLPGNRAFYLAIPPQGFPSTIINLGKAGLNKSPGWTRLVIEKPFGHDLESAKELNQTVHEHFSEEQIYRIDHYLGKETVQNLLVFRFANAIFESLWNRQHIDSVQITVSEELGVGHRAGYYDQAGAIRDMIQNHVSQLISLVAMEVPSALTAGAIRNEKIKVLNSMREIRTENVVTGQYAAGEQNGKQVRGYLQEEGVDDHSGTETFAAIKMEINNWRWQGVPFYIRTGKRLAQKLTQIVVRFHQPPVSLFQSSDQLSMNTNNLILTIQPDEGMDLQFEVKTPGDDVETETQDLGFKYGDIYEPLPSAYHTLLVDVMQGDQTLFVHADEAEASWRLYTPIIKADLPIHQYEPGSWGPKAAMNLTDRYHQRWLVQY